MEIRRYQGIYMDNNTVKMINFIKNDDNTVNIDADAINIDAVKNNIGNISELERAKELFNNCRYNDAELIFSSINNSEAAAWRMLCLIVTGNVGKRGGKIAALLKEYTKNGNINIDETIILLKTLIRDYESAIDRKTRNMIITSLYDTFNDIMKGKMAIAISDVNKRALDIVKQKGYNPSTYDDKTIPLKVLNSKLNKYKCRIRHYSPEEIGPALVIIHNENFLQEVVDQYMSIAYSIIRIDKDHLDTRNQEILKYIKGLYISNIAYEKELKTIRSMDKLQFINTLENLNERGWVCVTIYCMQGTRHFNIANNEEKAMCQMDIERASTASVVVSLIYKDIIEKRGYMINGIIVNQISKEDIAIGDVTNKYTHEYIGPVSGTIYCDK